MSKIIKSQQCVESHPRRLEPIDVDAFFIEAEAEAEAAKKLFLTKEIETKPETDNTDTEEEPALEEAVESEELESSEAETLAESDLGESTYHRNIGTDFASSLLGFDDEPRSVPVSKSRFTEEETVTEKETASTNEVEDINLDRLANVAETIGSIISGVEEGTGANPREEEINIINDAVLRAEEALKKAKSEADDITYGAESKASSIIGQANRQAESIMNTAKEQSELIIESAQKQAELIVAGARQQSEKIVEKAKQEAETTLEKTKNEVSGLLEETQKQVSVMLEDTKQEAVNIKEEARKEGLAAGREEAVARVKEELSTNLNQALELINEIETGRIERINSSEPELLKLAVKIAEKIIGAELKTNPSRWVEIVKEALTKVATANTVTLKLNPEDQEIFSRNIASLQEAFSEPKPIKIETDNSIAQGNCFIETDHGNLDARIKSQLDRIMIELLKVGRIE